MWIERLRRSVSRWCLGLGGPKYGSLFSLGVAEAGAIVLLIRQIVEPELQRIGLRKWFRSCGSSSSTVTRLIVGSDSFVVSESGSGGR